MRLPLTGVVFSWLASAALAAPVTGWNVVNPSTGGATSKLLSGALTDSPVLGNGSNDSAAMVALYADISGTLSAAPDVALANGQKVTLTGAATLDGINSSMEQFRWGLFNEAAAPFDAIAWRGFIASNSAGSGGGALRAKDAEPDSTFAQTGSAVNLKSAQDGDDFIDETYFFSMTVSRFNNEVSIDASLTTADDWSQNWKDVVAAPPTPVTFDFNRVGFLAGNGMHADRISFSNIDVTVAPVTALTLQVTTTGPHAGSVQIRNDQSTSFEIEYYEITSAGSLNVGGWNSLDDQEGADPELDNWEEAAGNGVKLLSEYQLSSTTTIAPSTSFTLGQAFTVGAAQDLRFFIGLADGSFVRGIVEYVPDALTGDYNGDDIVDAADYVAWRKNVGTNVSVPNDPTGGEIGPAQYQQWLTNFGRVPGGGASLSSSSNEAVPEPSAAVILLSGLFAMFVYQRAFVSYSQASFGRFQ